MVVIGGDDVSYGSKPKDAPNWRTKMLSENPVDLSRVHFLGKVPYGTYKKVLQVSAAHVYLTYPFVLSWSLLEAMACGCLIVASDTAPVREIIRDSENGLLVDFFDVGGVGERLLNILEQPRKFHQLRHGALSKAQEYAIKHGNQGYTRKMAAEKGALAKAL